MTEELKVTSPEEYAQKVQQANKSEGFLHRLKKTGAVVRLRYIDMAATALMGSLPMSLVAAVTSGDEGEGKTNDKKGINKKAKTPKLTPELAQRGRDNLIFMRQVVVENCLEPTIRYFEGKGVYFVNSAGEQVAEVDKDDFAEMLAVISGQKGNDGLERFPNRKTRRASVAKSRRKPLRSRSVGTAEGKSAQA